MIGTPWSVASLKLTTGGLAIVTPVTVPDDVQGREFSRRCRRRQIRLRLIPTVPEGQQVPLRPEHPVRPLLPSVRLNRHCHRSLRG